MSYFLTYMIGRLHVVRRLHVSSVSICLSHCYFLSVHGAAAVYVSIGRLHSLSVFYRASHNTPATPPLTTPRPPEGPQRQKRTPRETPPRRPQNRPHPNPQANPGKSHTTVPGSPPKNAAQLRPKSTKEPKQGQPRDPHEKRPPTTPTPATPGPQEAEKPTEAKRPKYRGTPCKYVYFLTKLTFLDIQSSDSVFWVGRLQS